MKNVRRDIRLLRTCYSSECVANEFLLKKDVICNLTGTSTKNLDSIQLYKFVVF